MGSLAFAAAARAVWTIVKDPNDPQRRLFLPAKLNLAQDPDGLAYRIEDGRVLWEPEPVKMHADDAFAEELSGRQMIQATRALNGGKLRNGLKTSWPMGRSRPMRCSGSAKENGFAERTLRRAFKEMGGLSKRGTDGWVWCLPGRLGHQDGQEDCQDGHVPP